MKVYVIPQKFKTTIDFTETYKQFENSHKAIREAMCLKAQFPASLTEIKDGDLFAGRVEYGPVGFRCYKMFGEIGYYCRESEIKTELEKEHLPEDYQRQLEELISFWKERTTVSRVEARDNPSLPQEIKNGFCYAADGNLTDTVVACYAHRFAGITLDFEKLLKLGIPGMVEEVEKFKKKAQVENKDVKLYEGMRISLELLIDVCHFYTAEAKEKASASCDGKRKNELDSMAEALSNIVLRAPGTLREAIQLFWLYVIMSGIENYGRLDVFFGDFYVNDVDSGSVSEDEALSMLQSLWRLMEEMCDPVSARVFIGGMGRRNEENADRFALLAMEATCTVKGLAPQLTMRIYKRMNPKLFTKALDVIGEGNNFPIIYNDDVNVPALANAFGASLSEAEQYIACDCGEYRLDHMLIGSPNVSINVMKALEVTLFNGFDPVSKRPMGLKTGEFTSFKTFDEFWNAYKTQMEYYAGISTDVTVPFFEGISESASNLFASMLNDGCIENGKDLVSGSKYKGCFVETYGNITTANSLLALKQLVYEKKTITPEKLLTILQANFEGYEKERSLMLDVPKFGNDDEAADGMAVAVQELVCSIFKQHEKRLNLDFTLADMINAGGQVGFGMQVGASPDGRMAGRPMNNANNPVQGDDRSGVTALLNSLTKIDPSNIGGQVQYLKLSAEMFTTHREKLEALLKTYFDNGGPQVMITVVRRGDLEKAIDEPEKYANLMVRVGGYSARFVTLDRGQQQDIIARTLN